jgi:peptidylprolyl isomerase
MRSVVSVGCQFVFVVGIAVANTLAPSSLMAQKSAKSLPVEAPALLFERHPLLVRVIEWQDRRETDSLVAALAHPSELVRARAALALGSVQAAPTASALVKSLSDSSAAVRRNAAFALGQLGMNLGTGESVETAEQGLLQRWDKETELAVRVSVIEALGKCGGQTALLRLTNNEDLKKPATNKSLATAGVLAIARLGLRKFMTTAVNTYCFEMLRRPDIERSPELAFAATFIFARAPVEQWRPFADALTTLVGTRKYPADGQMNLAKAFVKMKDAKYLEPVRTLAKSNDWRVRVECARAASGMVAATGTNSVVALLIGLSNDKSLHVKIAALSQLQKLTPLDVKTLQSLKSRAVAAGCDPRERGALLKAIAASEPLYAWKERERWKVEKIEGKNEVNTAFLQDFIEAVGMADDSAAQKYLQSLLLKSSLQDVFSLGMPATSSAKEEKTSLREAQRKDIFANAALMALHTAWKRRVRQTTNQVLASTATSTHFKTLEEGIHSGDHALITTAAQSLADSAFLPFGCVPLLVSRLQTLTAPKYIEPMQAIMRSLVQLKALEGLPRITQLLQDSTEALAKSAADAFEGLTGQRPQYRASKPTAQSVSLDRLREVWQNPFVQVTTRYGAFTISLDVESAPLTCLAIAELVKQGKLSGVPFHRVVANHVIQSGDVERGDGYGGENIKLRSEFVPTAFERGVVGIASAGKDTEGSQWFVMHTPQPSLDGRYTAFGRVTDGMNVVDQVLPYDDVIEMKIKARK